MRDYRERDNHAVYVERTGQCYVCGSSNPLAPCESCHCGEAAHAEPDGFTRYLCGRCTDLRCDIDAEACTGRVKLGRGMSVMRVLDRD